MSQLLLDLVPIKEHFLFVVAARSTKVNAITHAVLQAKTVNLQEMALPGLSDEDIGATLGCRIGTVRSSISRGLATLRINRASFNDRRTS